MSEQMTGTTTPEVSADLLRNIPLFNKLSDADRLALSKLLKSRTYGEHEPIFWMGENGEEMFIVQRGQVRLSYTDESGNDVTLAVLTAGAFFGELSLLDGGPRTATGRANTEAVILSLDRSNFYEFMERNPSAAVHMIATLGQRQRDSMARLQRGVKNVNEVADEEVTRLQRLVDRAAEMAASGKFLLFTLTFVIGWMVVQTILTRRYHPELIVASGFPADSPPYFFWLGFMCTLVSFLLTIFVLNSQRRQAARDHIRAELEYQVNLKAQLEVMRLHQKLDGLTAMVSGIVGKKDESGTGGPGGMA